MGGNTATDCTPSTSMRLCTGHVPFRRSLIPKRQWKHQHSCLFETSRLVGQKCSHVNPLSTVTVLPYQLLSLSFEWAHILLHWWLIYSNTWKRGPFRHRGTVYINFSQSEWVCKEHINSLVMGGFYRAQRARISLSRQPTHLASVCSGVKRDTFGRGREGPLRVKQQGPISSRLHGLPSP